MELEQIRLMREAGRLTNADARELREEVYMLQMASRPGSNAEALYATLATLRQRRCVRP